MSLHEGWINQDPILMQILDFLSIILVDDNEIASSLLTSQLENSF